MASSLKPIDSSLTAIKRARSAEQSKASTPTRERSFEFEDPSLPPFLCLSNEEIKAKFARIDANQNERLEHLRYGQDPDHPWAQTASFSLSARIRNRYYDIRPWDKARVKLKAPEGASDYINASPIVLECSKTGQQRNYIATQGPKEASVSHFWQMVWHETGDVAVIIMLTQLQEGPKEKCFQYFPENSDTPQFDFLVFDDAGEEQPASLTLKECKTDESANTTIRTLVIESQGKTKPVYHLFFQGWPDFGVPGISDRYALLALIKLSQEMNSGWDNPRIVHCSAGVGRTGSFIALEHLLAELEVGGMDDIETADEDPIFETVDSLRQQRMTMVQSDVQFLLLYELLKDATRAKLREQAIAEKMQSMTTGQNSPSIGEPVQKAMRFTRKMKGVFSGLRDRSSSRKGEGRKKSDLSNEKRFESSSVVAAKVSDTPSKEDGGSEPVAVEDPTSRPDSSSGSLDGGGIPSSELEKVETAGATSEDSDKMADEEEAVITSDTFHDAKESPENEDSPTDGSKSVGQAPTVEITVHDGGTRSDESRGSSRSASTSSLE